MRFAVTAMILVFALATGVASMGAAQSAQGSGAQASVVPDAAPTTVASVVGTYCAGCHNGTMRSPSGELLDQFDPAQIAAAPDAWSRAYRQLQAGTMPPVGAPRPSRAAADAALASIEVALGGATAPNVASSRQIATRLALLLWNEPPDALLQQDAERDRLTDVATVEGHVRRMLQDDRARAFVTRFFVPWLGLDRLSAAEPNRTEFPEYSVALRDAMISETELFLLSQLREDGDPVDLWRADYTYVNELLARHYGIDQVAGPEFRRVPLPGPERRGLLGQGSVLMVTSPHRPGNAGHTSPAARAIWVRMHFLGAAAPRPFPNAQPVRPDLPTTPQTRTLPTDPCVNCHRNFFPLGYALENFDPIGRWRTSDQAGPVDASGTFVDGASTNGVVELRNVLLQRSDAFRTTIVEKLFVFGAGRPMTAVSLTPESLVRARHALRATSTPRWSSLIAAIVRAEP